MPLSIDSVLNFIPLHIWQPLKKFINKDSIIVFDIPLKMATKYTPALLMVMLCLSLANQFVRDIEIDCVIAENYGKGAAGDNSELNNFCWNHETFLVAKALEPKMNGTVTYPGVSGYIKGKDELLQQRYYKYVWLILGKLMVISYLPYFFWKASGTSKVKPLVKGTGDGDVSVDQRVALFLDTIGFNGSFAKFYIFCKLFATFSPFAQWYYLCGFLGARYKYYGVDVALNVMDFNSIISAPWPNPMDALFPKMAKCEWSRYGFGGGIESKSAQCQLPMNNITQWSFFVYWWWMALIFFVNILSVFKLLIFTIPFFRRFYYRNFVGAACREDIEKALNCGGHTRNGKRSKVSRKIAIVDINLSFGDWIVLSFLKKNIEDWQFRDFIRQLATTENIVLQLKQVPIIPTNIVPSCPPMDSESDNENPDNSGHRVRNMQMGFVQPLPKSLCDSCNPTDPACDHIDQPDK